MIFVDVYFASRMFACSAMQRYPWNYLRAA